MAWASTLPYYCATDVNQIPRIDLYRAEIAPRRVRLISSWFGWNLYCGRRAVIFNTLEGNRIVSFCRLRCYIARQK